MRRARLSILRGMAFRLNFVSPRGKRGRRIKLLLLVFYCVALFLSSTLIISRTVQMHSNEVEAPRPPMCFPQQLDETSTTPTLAIQQASVSDGDLWHLLDCCTHSKLTSKRETVCGRYGCCQSKCYEGIMRKYKSLELDDDAYHPKKAFFVETSSSSSLNYRQACSVESMAMLNPDINVYVLFTSEIIDLGACTSTVLLKDYRNIHFRSLFPLGDFFTGTPMEHWYFCSGWNHGPYAVSHASDALRFMLLYKFGGYYFDSDVYMIRKLPEKLKNFVAFEDVNFIASSTIHMERGHAFNEVFVREFTGKYNASSWANNGPDVVRRAMVELCKDESLIKANETCRGVTILPTSVFQPIPWYQHRVYFSEYDELPDLENSFNGTVIGAHVWNKMSAASPIKKALKHRQVMAHLASTKCPSMFQAAPEVF